MKAIANLLMDRLKIRHFLVIFIISLPLSAFLLRQNNLMAVELRDKVLSVDEDTGDINQVAPHLEELRSYILSHMNTNMGTVELPGTFNSAVERLRIAAENSGTANGGIYADAQRVCEDPSVVLAARAQCIQDYVVSNSRPGTDAVLELNFPDKSLYAYSFISPTWSPDLAGFSTLLSISSFIVLVFLFVTRVVSPFLGRIIDRDPLE